jgi:hypothetical protein
MADLRRIKTLILCIGLAATLLAAVCSSLYADTNPPASAYERKTFFPGTSQAVTVHYIFGREPGPTLLVFGGIHGDEAAGFFAAERFSGITLGRGNLIIVPRLNAAAIAKGKRQGLGGDMNRLFDLTKEMARRNPDAKVVELAKSLIQRADFVLNLHQAYDFYDPKWISRHRNPSRWGQSNVIDTPIYLLPNGERLEPERFARGVCRRSNDRIREKNYHFLVNNTNTQDRKTRHMEQRGSLTYYALTKQHKIALGIEATKNCSLPKAIAFLTIAVNSAMQEAGIQPDRFPDENFRVISQEMKGKLRPS